ncbi:hypothetical protein J6590_079536 [Homalodisca vitripennis]|nr:hypothetical protein J6590_079536 [Homalodisca vitripennis]
MRQTKARYTIGHKQVGSTRPVVSKYRAARVQELSTEVSKIICASSSPSSRDSERVRACLPLVWLRKRPNFDYIVNSKLLIFKAVSLPDAVTLLVEWMK